MALVDYKGIEVLDPEPTGEGGLAIQDNFVYLVDNVQKKNLDAIGFPQSSNDETEGYSKGSLWWTQRLGAYDYTYVCPFVCFDATEGDAKWYPWIPGTNIYPGDTDLGGYGYEIRFGEAARTEYISFVEKTAESIFTTHNFEFNSYSGFGGIGNRTTFFRTRSSETQASFTNADIVFNENGADQDFRVEGDTATALLRCDAGLNAVQIGTTTFGNIADFRSSAIVFNEDGANRDFRVEGDTVINLLFTDASVDRVGVGTNVPDRLLHVETNPSGNTIVPVIRLTRTTTSTPASGIGVAIEFEVETSNNNNEVGAVIQCVPDILTSGQEDFSLRFLTMKDGAAATERFRINEYGIGCNGVASSSANVNLRTISNRGALLLITDGPSGIAVLNGYGPSGPDSVGFSLEVDGSAQRSRILYNNVGVIHDLLTAYSNIVVINEDGTDVDFRVEGDTNANLFVCDAGANWVGIGKDNPQVLLDIGVFASTNIVRINCGNEDKATLEFYEAQSLNQVMAHVRWDDEDGEFEIASSNDMLLQANDFLVLAQVHIGSDGTTPASAQLAITSTSKGFLPSRMTTTQREAISDPAEGLMVWDTTAHAPFVFDGTDWQELTYA